MKPKTMSQAMLMALEDKKLLIKRGSYFSTSIKNAEARTQVCAVGGILAEIAPKTYLKEITKKMSYGTFIGEREDLIQEICGRIKGACEPMDSDIVQEYELPQFNKYNYSNTWRWIDFVEHLFEEEERSFRYIIKILVKYNR